MNIFWTGVGAVTAVTVLLLAFSSGGFDLLGGEDSDIVFSDLETECRMESFARMDSQGRRIVFEGSFPGESPRAELNTRFTRSGDRITLNVRSGSGEVNESFFDDCLASVYYSGRTVRLPEGSYLVEVRHDGETAQKRLMNLRGR